MYSNNINSFENVELKKLRSKYEKHVVAYKYIKYSVSKNLRVMNMLQLDIIKNNGRGFLKIQLNCIDF